MEDLPTKPNSRQILISSDVEYKGNFKLHLFWSYRTERHCKFNFRISALSALNCQKRLKGHHLGFNDNFCTKLNIF